MEDSAVAAVIRCRGRLPFNLTTHSTVWMINDVKNVEHTQSEKQYIYNIHTRRLYCYNVYICWSWLSDLRSLSIWANNDI